MRGLFFKCVIGICLIAAGWTALWVWGSGRVETEIAQWMANEKAKGRDIHCDTLERSGYPFKVRFMCKGFTLVEARGQKATLSAAHAEAMVFAPKTIHAAFIGPLMVSTNDQPVLKAEWSSLAITANMRLDGFFNTANMAAEKLVITDATISNAPQLRLERHDLALSLNADDPTTLEVNSHLSQLVVSQGGKTLGPLDLTLKGSGTKAVAFAPRPHILPLRAWQAAGGRFDLALLRLQLDPSLIHARGMISLTDDGRPAGTLKLVMAEPETFLKAVGLGQQANPMVMMALSALGAPEKLEGRDARAYPVLMEKGVLKAGPLPVPLPSLF